MSEQSIADWVKQIVATQLDLHSDQVTPESKFVEDLGADSLDTIELVMAFEEAFGIEILDDDVEVLTTVGETITYIEGHVKNKKVDDKLSVTVREALGISQKMNSDRVIVVIAKLLDVSPSLINCNTKFEGNFELDNADILQLSSELEKEFGLRKNDVDEGVLANFKTAGQVIDSLELVLAVHAL